MPFLPPNQQCQSTESPQTSSITETLTVTVICVDTPFQSFFATDQLHHPHIVLSLSQCLNKLLMQLLHILDVLLHVEDDLLLKGNFKKFFKPE